MSTRSNKILKLSGWRWRWCYVSHLNGAHLECPSSRWTREPLSLSWPAYWPHKVISAIVWKQLLITCGFRLKGLRCLQPLETAKSSEAMFAGPPDFPSRSWAVIFVFSFNLGILLVLRLSPRMGWGIRGEDYCSDPSCVHQIFYPCHSPSTYWELAFRNSESRSSLCLLLPQAFSQAKMFYRMPRCLRLEDQLVKERLCLWWSKVHIISIYLTFKHYSIKRATNQKIKKHFCSALIIPRHNVFVMASSLYLSSTFPSLSSCLLLFLSWVLERFR